MSFLNLFLSDSPRDDSVASVVRNLTYLLNSKSGYGSPLCNFGLGDYYAQQGATATAESVMHEILANITAYEPRLRPSKIELKGDRQLPLLFELYGELSVLQGPPLAQSTRIKPVRLAIVFDPVHGQVGIAVIEVTDVR